MKMTRGHAELLPDSSSSRVKPAWRISRPASPTSTATSTGAAAIRVAQRERMPKNFILATFHGARLLSGNNSLWVNDEVGGFLRLERENEGFRSERELESDERDINHV